MVHQGLFIEFGIEHSFFRKKSLLQLLLLLSTGSLLVIIHNSFDNPDARLSLIFGSEEPHSDSFSVGVEIFIQEELLHFLIYLNQRSLRGYFSSATRLGEWTHNFWVGTAFMILYF